MQIHCENADGVERPTTGRAQAPILSYLEVWTWRANQVAHGPLNVGLVSSSTLGLFRTVDQLVTLRPSKRTAGLTLLVTRQGNSAAIRKQRHAAWQGLLTRKNLNEPRSGPTACSQRKLIRKHRHVACLCACHEVEATQMRERDAEKRPDVRRARVQLQGAQVGCSIMIGAPGWVGGCGICE
jgi:hypothetical protein